MLCGCRSAAWLALVAGCPLEGAQGEDCIPGGNNYLSSDKFFLSASSDQGAVGDVVGSEVSLTIDGPLVVDGVEGNLAGFVIVGCYDGAALELLDAQAYSEFYDTFAFLSYFSSSPEQANFWLAGSVKKGVAGTLFAYGTSLPLFTLYFRVRGEPNTTTELRFCDNVISGRSCAFNQLDYDFPGKSLEVKSPKHTSG